ncbi:MAG: tyrosine-type recombinase/integrase [Spirochaetales bacterium]|jgi:integrase|nr:tyrosine-type recombinase/integrase [Spirochaetales bacterium]
MPLTDTAIRNAKPREKQYKLSDDKGLYLLVKKAGKYFRLDYRFNGKRKTIALGVYPEVKLKDARERRDEARQLLQNDVDPAQHKKETKHLRVEQAANSLEAIAREWFTKNKHIWTGGHSRTIMARLENNVFPWLGSRPVMAISAPELLAMLRRIEDRGALETAHRVKQICGQVFRYAIATGRAERDPCADLRGALPPTKPKHMATITDPKQVGGLLRAIDGYEGHLITRCALRLAPLVFVRPGELRHAEWAEINLGEAEWKIPAEKMKMRKPHIVPLSQQVLAVLGEIEPLTGRGRYVFPSPRTIERPMSNNAVLSALRRMDYAKEEMSGHGFRAMASTILHEQGWPTDVIELQLAHAEKNSVRAAYNHAQHLPERQRMMQAWADYLDKLKS